MGVGQQSRLTADLGDKALRPYCVLRRSTAAAVRVRVRSADKGAWARAVRGLRGGRNPAPRSTRTLLGCLR